MHLQGLLNLELRPGVRFAKVFCAFWQNGPCIFPLGERLSDTPFGFTERRDAEILLERFKMSDEGGRFTASPSHRGWYGIYEISMLVLGHPHNRAVDVHRALQRHGVFTADHESHFLYLPLRNGAEVAEMDPESVYGTLRFFLPEPDGLLVLRHVD